MPNNPPIPKHPQVHFFNFKIKKMNCKKFVKIYGLENFFVFIVLGGKIERESILEGKKHFKLRKNRI